MEIDILAKLFGEWARGVNIFSTLFKIALIVLLSTILGCERARNRHAAGLRTFIVVSLSSTIAGIVDLFLIQELKTTFSFVSAATIIGISIITTNTILFSSKSQLKGLTTSTTLWAMVIIGVVIGLGLYTVGLIAYIALMICLLAFTKLEKITKNNSSHFEIHVELSARNLIKDFTYSIRKIGLKIDDIEINPAYANSGLAVYSISLTIIGNELKNKTHSEVIEILSSLECVSFIEEL